MLPQDFTELQRQQLDAQLPPESDFRTLESPSRGWIHALRTALGMSTAQFARRLGITRQAAAATESRERDRSITIENLERAAVALDCRVVIALVPNSSLEDTVRRQAARKSAEQRERVVHTMRLEAQHVGVSEALRDASDYWLVEGRRALWD